MQQVKQLVTKNEQEWRSGESTCVPSLRGGGGVLPIVAFMGRLRPKGVPFSCFRYMKG